MNTKKLYVEIASRVGARINCLASGNREWEERHTERIKDLCLELPSGSGFDNGTKLDFDKSTAERLVFHTAFHHMNESGMYDGWTEHTVTVTPSLQFGFRLSITGRDRNDIKSYIAEQFEMALSDDAWSIAEAYRRALTEHPEIEAKSKWIDQCHQVWICLGKEFKSYLDAYKHALNSLEA